MAHGFEIRDSSGNLLLDSTTTTMLMHDSFTQTGWGSFTKTYSNIPSGSTIYMLCTWATNQWAWDTYAESIPVANYIFQYTSTTFSYSYSELANGDFEIDYTCTLHNDIFSPTVSPSIYDISDFHIKVFVK